MLTDKEKAEVYMAYGYRRVSRRHNSISRINELNWRREIPGIPKMDNTYDGWEDHYRRCYSKDVLELPEIAQHVASSSGDHIGYINMSGVYLQRFNSNTNNEASFAWSLLNKDMRKECFEALYGGKTQSNERYKGFDLWIGGSDFKFEKYSLTPSKQYEPRKVLKMDLSDIESRVVMRLMSKQEENKMLGVKRKNVWTDGRNVEHVISDMSDDYVRNCMVCCQKRLDTLEQVNEKFDSKDVRVQVKRMNESIEMFVAEMDWRRKKGIEIRRDEGCEDSNRSNAEVNYFA